MTAEFLYATVGLTLVNYDPVTTDQSSVSPSGAILLSSIAVTADGKTAYTVDGETGVIFVISLSNPVGSGSMAEVASAATGSTGPGSCCLTPDGTKLLVCGGASDPNALYIMDTTTLVVTLVPWVTGSPWAVRVVCESDSVHAYVTDLNGDGLYPINLSTLVIGTPIACGAEPLAAAITADDSTVFVTDYSGSIVSYVDTATATVTHTVAVDTHPSGLAVGVGATAGLLAVTCDSKHLQIITISTHTVLSSAATGNNPSPPTFSLDGTTLYLACGGDDTIVSYDTATYTPTTVFSTGGSHPFDVLVAVAPPVTTSLTGESDWTVDFADATLDTNLGLTNWLMVHRIIGGVLTPVKEVLNPNIDFNFRGSLSTAQPVPPPPDSVSASVVGTGEQILVTWSALPPPYSGITYKLYGSNDGTTYVLLSTQYDGFSYVDNALGFSQTRYYKITTTNAYGTSAYSSVVEEETAAEPTFRPPFVAPVLPPAIIEKVVVTGGINLPTGMV